MKNKIKISKIKELCIMVKTEHRLRVILCQLHKKITNIHQEINVLIVIAFSSTNYRNGRSLSMEDQSNPLITNTV